MLYTVSSRYRKAKDVCSHNRLFLTQEKGVLKSQHEAATIAQTDLSGTPSPKALGSRAV